MFGSALETRQDLRRAAVFCLASFVWLGLGPRLFAQQQFPERVPATSSLTLIQPSDPAFDDVLATYFPGISDLPKYQQSIRPFLVLLENNDAGLAATAYAIQWKASYQAGPTRTLNAIFVNRWLMYRFARTVLKPQSVRLISPLYNVTPQEYQSNRVFAQEYPASHYPPADTLASVVADVDGVVYSDGSFIGPNRTHVWQRFLATLDAEHDEALTILNMFNSSTSPLLLQAKVNQALNNDVQRQASEHGQGHLVDMYIWARGDLAQDMERILRDRGIGVLQTLLTRRIDNSRMQETLTPLAKYY